MVGEYNEGFLSAALGKQEKPKVRLIFIKFYSNVVKRRFTVCPDFMHRVEGIDIKNQVVFVETSRIFLLPLSFTKLSI